MSIRQNNAFKAINRAWQQGATVQATMTAGGASLRYAIGGLAESAQDGLVNALAIQAERTPSATGRAIRKPRIGLYQPWTGSMSEGWTRWLLEQYGFAFVLVHPEDFKAPLDEKIDVLIIADDARVPIAGAGWRRGGRAEGHGRSGRNTPTIDRVRSSGFGAIPCAAAEPSSVSAASVRHSAVEAAGAQRRRRTAL